MYNNGVRAEPKFLRDPTSLESISSGISKLSSYVTSNLSKKKSSIMIPNSTTAASVLAHQQFSETITEEEPPQEEVADIITFASFDKLNQMSCLLLGYQDGFQLWDITSPDNVHEICSIRDKEIFGLVSCIHFAGQTEKEITIAIVTEKDKKSKIIIYSLKTYSIVYEIKDPVDYSQEDDTALITSIKSNHKIMALGCLSSHKSSIHLLSMIDYKPVTSPLFDVYHDIHTGPIFTLGSRFIAYATNTAVLNSDPVMTSFSNKLQVDKDVKGAAKDIAKEVVSGMKTLGEFSYQRLSNYFGNNYSISQNHQQQQQSIPHTTQHTIPTEKEAKKITPSGMVIIRDIYRLPSQPTKNISTAAVAHFRPHTHPISCLNFNQSGTLLMSASKQGHTFHVFSILTNTLSNGNVSHLYSLSRGFTDAQVEDCQFSSDSNWCSISTARGTSHVYAINPYGGKPEILGHVHSKVNNSHYSPFASKIVQSPPTTLGSVARIKQRRRMPELNEEEAESPPVSRLQKEPRSKLTTYFVNASQSPYFVNNDTQQKDSIKNHHQHQNGQYKQNPPSDTLIFGFDEEYDEDGSKIMNDEIGYQDLYTFHPSGILTLYRCWVVKMAIKGSTDLSLKKESVAEWKVARDSDWDPLMAPMEIYKEKKQGPALFWLSNAEITTYPFDQQPIWSHRQFVFQTFQKDFKNELPVTETLVMPKEMPEPVSSRIDRVRKTTTRIANDVEENMDDALQELEDNISKAMQTSFSPSESASHSPAKWLSTSAEKNVSFEDAYLIHVGSGLCLESLNDTTLQSPLIHLEDDDIHQKPLEDDSIHFECDVPVQNDLYLLDDNEVARPFESIFEGFHTRDDSDNFPWNE